jgi:hypothetical protein
MAAAPYIIAASAGIGIYGQREANKAQAKAENENAESYKQQQLMSIIATRREADIFQRESQMTIGTATNMFARAGIDISGSALMQLAGMKELANREYKAIQISGQINSNILAMRKAQAERVAGILTSSRYNNIQSLGTLLNMGATVASLSSTTSKAGSSSGGTMAAAKTTSSSRAMGSQASGNQYAVNRYGYGYSTDGGGYLRGWRGGNYGNYT